MRNHSLESPPRSGSVPLKGVGGPTHEYDIVAGWAEVFGNARGYVGPKYRMQSYYKGDQAKRRRGGVKVKDQAVEGGLEICW